MLVWGPQIGVPYGIYLFVVIGVGNMEPTSDDIICGSDAMTKLSVLVGDPPQPIILWRPV